MAQRYALYNFMTGDVIDSSLDLTGGNDKVNLNIITGGSASVEVLKSKLPAEGQNNWRRYFRPLARGVAFINDDVAWNAPGAIGFAGMINKVQQPIGSGVVRVQVASVNEYCAARVHAPWTTYTDPPLVDDDGVEIPPRKLTAATWDDMLRHLAFLCFEQPPDATAPRTPAIIRNGLLATTSGDREMPDEYDGTTYAAAMSAVRDDLSGNGVEWQWVPRFTDSTKSRICFDLVVGTEAAPHINEVPMSIDLTGDSSYAITEHSTTYDSVDEYNRILVRYETEPEQEGLSGEKKLRPEWNQVSDVPLVDKYVNTSSVMDVDGVNKLVTAYLKDGLTGGQEVAFSVAHEWDKSAWIGNLGKLVTFTGYEGTLSSGHTLTVRLTGIDFNAEDSVVKASFQQLATVYPQTTEAKKKKKAFEPVQRQGWTPYGPKGDLVHPDRAVQAELDKLKNFDPGAGGGTTPPPTMPDPTDWGVDGEQSPEEQHGGEGHHPGSPAPDPTGSQALERKDVVVLVPEFDGISPISARSITQSDTNRLYGVDHDMEGWGTKFGHTGTQVHYNGGIAGGTGKKLTPYRDLFIKKTFMTSDLSLGPVETVGKIDAAMMESLMPEYEWNEQYEGQNYDVCAGYHVTNWWVRNRYYVGILTYTYSEVENGYRHRNPLSGYSYYRPYYSNAKITVLSIAVNRATGKLEGEWRTEPWTFDHGTLPHAQHIAREGDRVYFGAGVQCAPVKAKNLNGDQFTMLYSKRLNEYTYVSWFGEGDPRSGWATFNIYSAFAECVNLETGVKDYGQADPYNVMYSAHNYGIDAPNGLQVKDFANPDGKLEWLIPGGDEATHVEGKKWGGYGYHPVVGNGWLAVKGSEQSDIMFFSLLQKPLPRLIPLKPYSDGSSLSIRGNYGALAGVANGAFIAQGFGYSSPAVKSTLVKISKGATSFTRQAYYDSGPYAQLHHKGPNDGGFPTSMYVRFAITKPLAVSGETGYQEGRFMSNFYSYNGILFCFKNGGGSPTAAITVRATRVGKA